jgi:hypothetical protein
MEDLAPLFMQIAQEHLAQFPESFDVIRYVDPEIDNDGFCEYTKKNTIRRNTTKFFAAMAKQGAIPVADIYPLLAFLLDKLRSTVNNMTTNLRIELEEVTENVFLLVSSMQEEWKKWATENGKWDAILELLHEFAATSVKEKPNMTSRAKFKIQDLIAAINHHHID